MTIINTATVEMTSARVPCERLSEPLLGVGIGGDDMTLASEASRGASHINSSASGAERPLGVRTKQASYHYRGVLMLINTCSHANIQVP